MRKQFTAEFKAKVAIEAIKGNKTVGQIASEYEIHPSRVSEWKSDFLEKAKVIFEPHQLVKDHSFAEKEAALYQQIGQLTCEIGYLKKKLLEISE
jgi:transposase-like protein